LIVEIDPAKRLTLHGTSLVHAVGEAALVEMHVVSSRLERVEPDISTRPRDTLCICQQRHGPSWFDTGLIGEFLLALGTLAPSQSDGMGSAARLATPVLLRLVTVPIARCNSVIDADAAFATHAHTAQLGLQPLYSSYFGSLFEQAPRLTGTAANIVVETLVQLALAGRSPPDDVPRKPAGTREARLRTAQQLIEQHLDRPDLSPAWLSAMLGISVRQLHLLFEPSGTTCARYVQTKRLERACALLSRSPHRPVADVAFACGFDSLTTFYRAFRGAFRMSPSDFRRLPGDGR
jgi:AraC-like DNA-binding protein